MAAFDTIRTAYGSDTAVTRITSFVNSLIASVVAWNDSRTTRDALSRLSDRELDDIGLVRGDIENIGNGDFFR